MSFIKKAAQSGLWFAGTRFISQIFTWIITIAIARILVPGDYGLMAMASILTGYIEVFSELGLGAAIIQKKEISQQELSSIFWLSMIIGAAFSIVSFTLAYPTAWIFSEPRIIPITKLISVLFLISAFSIVPYNILAREIKFKEIGMIQLSSVIIASLSMFWMARNGFGVWTLINGTIIQRIINTSFTFSVSKWLPTLHFRVDEAKYFIKFGITVAGARSVNYLFEKSDKVIVGRIFNAVSLGYYSFAMQLASFPTEKIVSIINLVSFPVFSRYQSDIAKIQNLYLETTKYIVLIVAPLFLSGVFFGDEIITCLLGEKWIPIIFMFKMLCITQIINSLSAISGIVHLAQGRPHWGMFFTLSCLLIMPFSIFLFAKGGINYVVIPWVSIYPFLCLGWIWITLKKLNISPLKYLSNLLMPSMAIGFMLIGIMGFKYIFNVANLFSINNRAILIQEVIAGFIFYLSFLLIFERQPLIKLWNLRK